MPNAYNGVSGHSLLMVKDVVVQEIVENGYLIASTDCNYFTYVYDRTYGASLEAGDVIDLVGKMYVYYGLDELASVTGVRRERESKQLALALSLKVRPGTHAHPLCPRPLTMIVTHSLTRLKRRARAAAARLKHRQTCRPSSTRRATTAALGRRRCSRTG